MTPKSFKGVNYLELEERYSHQSPLKHGIKQTQIKKNHLIKTAGFV